jgi:hypothetical protein
MFGMTELLKNPTVSRTWKLFKNEVLEIDADFEISENLKFLEFKKFVFFFQVWKYFKICKEMSRILVICKLFKISRRNFMLWWIQDGVTRQLVSLNPALRKLTLRDPSGPVGISGCALVWCANLTWPNLT